MNTSITSRQFFHLPGRWRSLIQCFASLVVLAVAGPAPAQTALPEVDGATMSATGERTSLIRGTSRLRSTVDVILKNAGSKTVEPPLHAVVTFTPEGGRSLTGLTLPGASGGPGVAPYQTFFIDLTAEAPQGLAAGGTLKLPLVFERPSTLTVKYKVQLHGVVNRDPLANPGGPYVAKAGKAVSLDGSRSSDPDNDPITLEWRFQDGSTAAGPAVSKTFAAPGLHEITLTATDGRGGESVRIAAVAVTPDGVFALGRSRVLDSNGHPLPGAEIRETGPSGERTFTAGAETGFASLGGLPGSYVWRFSAPGHLPVWRRATLPAGTVTLIPSPWLPVIAKDGVPVSLLEETRIASPGNTIALTFPAGAFPQAGAAVLTPVAGQALAAPLPPGWSPLAGFNITLPDQAPALPATLALTFSPAPPAGRPLLLVSYDNATGGWKHRGSLSNTGTVRTGSIPTSGPWAIALPDLAPSAPSLPAEGEFLAAAPLAADVPAGVTATGSVSPAESAASTDPARVTAAAKVNFISPTPLPSGVWFRTTVAETYDLRDGARFRTPVYDTTFFAWQGLGDNNPATLDADFPLRPRILLGGDVLAQAQIHVEVLPPGGITSAVFSPDGGELSAGSIRILIPPGASGGLGTGELRELDPAGFSSTSNYPITAAFSLDFAGFLPGSILNFSYSGKTEPLADYVLARFLTDGLSNGFQPVLRLRSNAAGLLTPNEPSGELPGLDRAGQYTLIKLPSAHGLVQGTVRLATDNSPAPGASVRLPGQPWLAVTPAGGGYQLLSPAGPLTLTALRDREGFTGRATGDMPAPPAPQAIDIPLGSAAPFVVSTTPAAGALKVPVVTPVTLNFSERMQPGPFAVPGAIRLLDPSNTSIPATLSLDLSGRTATLLPNNPLTAATAYKIILSPDLRDLQNLALDGPREFAFTTIAPAARGEGAQLTIYEPGGAGPTPADRAIIDAIPGYTPGTDKTKVVAVGGAGSADPEVAVILVNETTGTTATVLSKSDGSFANFIEAAEEDFITATFINTNGTRVSLPATRQKFDDGRIGLFRQGGILEAESDGGPVEVIIEPETIPDRTVFKFESIPLATLRARLADRLPELGQLLGGVTLTADGAVNDSLDLKFPVNPADLDLPPGLTPEEAGFVVTQEDEFAGVPVYNILDKAVFSDGFARTASPPFTGVRPTGAIPPSGKHPPGARRQTRSLLLGVPMFFFAIPARVAVVTGKVIVVPEDTPSSEFAGILAPNFPGVAAAVVSVGFPGNGRGISRGAFVGRTNAVGGYAISVPVEGDQPVPLRADSFRFSTAATGVAQAPNLTFLGLQIRLANLAFRRARDAAGNPDTLAPFATIETGGGFLPVNQPVQIFINAVDDTSRPQLTSIDWIKSGPFSTEFSISLPDRAPLGNADVELQNLGPVGEAGVRSLRTGLSLKVNKPSLVLLKGTALDVAGNSRDFLFKLQFRPQPPPSPSELTSSDPTDTTRPQVRSTYPGHQQVVEDGGEVVARFSEAVSQSSEFGEAVSAIGSVSGPLPALLELFLDQLGGKVKISGALPDEEVTVSFSSGITDLNGNTLLPHTFTYRTAPVLKKDFRNDGTIAALADVGSRSIVVERVAGDGRLSIFDQGNSLEPAAAKGTLSLPPFPRALAIVPEFEFKRQFNVSVAEIAPVEKKTLAVVAGGLLGDDQIGQWLWIVDITDPSHPTRVAGALTTVDFAAAITKLKVSKGVIYASIQTPEGPFIQIIHLQAFILGSTLPLEELAPRNAALPGLDLNKDGDYVDAGEQLPRPARGRLAGLQIALPLAARTTLNDFDVDSEVGTLVAALRGVGADVRSRYQTILLGGDVIGTGEAEDLGAVIFGTGESPFRVMLDRDVTLSTPNGTRTFSLISVVASNNTIFLYDILSNPLAPALLETLQLPAGSGSILHLARAGGYYLAATANATYRIDLARLVDESLITGFGQVSPAIVQKLPVGSAGRNLGSTPFQITGLVDGKLQRFILPPPMTILRFAGVPLVKPLDVASLPETEVEQLLGKSSLEGFLVPSRLGSFGPQFQGALAVPPPAERHYHVKIEASGELGRQIRLGIDSTDAGGQRQPPRGPIHAPVILTDNPSSAGVDNRQPNTTAQVAYRLSDDPNHSLYNVYLSDALVLTADAFNAEVEAKLKTVTGRQALQVGAFMRVAIEAADNPAVLGSLLTPTPRLNPSAPTGMSRSFPSFCGDFVDSPNPGSTEANVSIAGVSVQSGEFRHSTADLLLETPGLPLELRRTYESGTHGVTGFGRGWDFEFNMRLCELPLGLVPPGVRIPLTIYGNPDNDRVATAGDVILVTGSGDVVLFRLVSPDHGNEQLRPAMANDPAIRQFGWEGKVSALYQPPFGSFHQMVRLVDGVFVLVDTAGRRTYFSADGRLDRIVFPYEASRLQCRYRADGRLDRVIGDGNTEIKFGYYDFSSSPAFQLGQDFPTEKATEAGLIARVQHGDRQVRYFFDTSGNLDHVDGVGGRSVYGYDLESPHQLTAISRETGGQPPGQRIFYTDGLVTAVEVDGQRTEFAGSVKTAADRATGQPAKPSAKVPGAPPKELPVDENGHPTEIAGKAVKFNKFGQLESYGSDADGFKTTYDANNPVFRFRGNLTAITQGNSTLTDAFDGSAWNRLRTRTNNERVVTSYNYVGAQPGEIIVTTGTRVVTMKFNQFGLRTEETTDEGGVSFKETTLFDRQGLPSGTKLGDLITSGFSRRPDGGVASMGVGDMAFTPSFSTAGQSEGGSMAGVNFQIKNDPNTARPSEVKVSAADGAYARNLTYAGSHPDRLDGITATETGVPTQNVIRRFDDQQRLTSVTRNGVVTTMEYDGVRVKSVREPGLSRSLTFASNGQVGSVTEQGIAASFTYDAQRRLKTKSAQSATTSFTYARGDQLDSVTTTDATGTLRDEVFTYDLVGRIRTVRSDGATYAYEYFPDNTTRRVTIDGIERNAITKNAAGLTTGISLLGGVIQSRFEDFHPTSARPRKVTTTFVDGTNLVQDLVYDELGRLKSTTEPGSITTSYDYDNFGHVKKETDPDGVTVQHTFTPTGLPLTQTFTDGTGIAHAYNNDLTVQSKGPVTYTYDSELLVSKVTYPDATTEEFLARNSHMLPAQIKQGVASHNLGYTDGRVSSMSATLGTAQVDFKHDGLGRVREIDRNGYKVGYGHSNLTGITSEETPLGKWTVEADNLARVSRETYPSGWTHSYQPNAAGLPTKISELGIEAISWLDLELPTSVKFSNGREIRWLLDPASRVIGLEYRNENGVVAAFDYGLTPGGRVLHETRRHENATDIYQRLPTARGMKIQGVLFSASAPSAANSTVSIAGLGYDADSEIDWTGATGTPGPTRSIIPQAADTLTRNDRGSVETGPVWVNISGAYEKIPARFTYDSFGYLEKVERLEAGGSNVVVTYQRDGRGRIVGKTVAGPPQRCIPGDWRYAWKDDQLIEEYQMVAGQSAPQLQIRYLYLGHALIVVQRNIPGQGFKDFIPLRSRNGSIGGYLDENWAIAEFTRYGLFGLPEHIGLLSGVTAPRSAISGTLQFQGLFCDEETGLYFTATRTLHPVFGSFLERETDYYRESRAFYTAFNGDPATYVDPGGTDSGKPQGDGADRSILGMLLRGGLSDKNNKSVVGGIFTIAGNRIAEPISQKGIEISINKNSKAIGLAGKLLKSASGFFPSETQEKIKTVASVLDLAKNSLRLAEELSDAAKNKADFVKASEALDRLDGAGASKRYRFALKSIGVPTTSHSGFHGTTRKAFDEFSKELREAREKFVITRNDRLGTFTGAGGAVLGILKTLMIDVGHLDRQPTRLAQVSVGGVELADAALTFAGMLGGESIVAAQAGLRGASAGLQADVFRRNVIGGLFVDLPASSLVAGAATLKFANDLGYSGGKGLLTMLYGLADPDVAMSYRQTCKMFEQDGGYLGFRTIGGVLLSLGAISDETGWKLNQLADFSIMGFLEQSQSNPSRDQFLRELNVP